MMNNKSQASNSKFDKSAKKSSKPEELQLT